MQLFDLLKKYYYHIAMLSCVAMFFSCENDIKAVKQFTAQDTTADVIAYNVDFFRSDSGRIQARLIAPEMQSFTGTEDKKTVFPKGFKIFFYNKNEEIESSIEGEYGIQYEDKGIIEAEKNVVYKNLVELQELFTEKLIFDDNKDSLFSPVKVRIVTLISDITGDSLASDAKLTDPTVYNIRGSLDVEE